MTDDRSPLSDPRLPAPWRRPLLIAAGLSLLATGVVLNADRLGLSNNSDDTMRLEEVEVVAHSQPFRGVEHEEEQGFRHRGEEGKMGRPSAKQKAGLYAMKGPKNATPQMSRNIDPSQHALQAGILGQMQAESGHFLASPYGGAFAVGNDDADVWGGHTEARDGSMRQHERYGKTRFNPFIQTLDDPKSTFSVDVDTASYANVRRFLSQSRIVPPPDAVRTEEMINYFDYDYPEPSGDSPFSVTTEVGPAPWNAAHRVVHVGIQGRHVEAGDVPPRNLVFLIDVSGSMSSPDRLGLIKKGLVALTQQMNARDRISLVVYAGAAGAVLPPTSGSDHRTIIDALERLESGGSTNGAAGIHLAYDLAQQAFIEDGINRVVIASDGDFNVGTHDHSSLMALIEAKRETGVFLSVLGVGTGNLNDHMMEQLADKGNGNYAYIDGELEARKVLIEESGAMLQTIAKDVKIQVDFDPDQVAQHRLIGYENRVLAHRDFDDDTKDAGEIGAGHTVTALYEVIPAAGAGDDPLMTVNLRYKRPTGSRSRKISVPVRDDGRPLAESSTDYRFSAAVAMLGQKLRGHDAQAETRYRDIASLALGSLGTDPYCYRHQFVELAIAAGTLQGESISLEVPGCRATPPKPRVQEEAGEEPTLSAPAEPQGGEPFDWSAFFLEVLRLLPPLLALPMFVLAFRSPRRRT